MHATPPMALQDCNLPFEKAILLHAVQLWVWKAYIQGNNAFKGDRYNAMTAS